MTDMLIDGTITNKLYDEKLEKFTRTVFESIIEKVYVGRKVSETYKIIY